MEEELNYVTVTFKTNDIPAHEKSKDMDTIYEEVKTGDTNPVLPENKKKAPPFTLIHLVAASLGIFCIILVSAIIALCIHFNRVKSEQHAERAQNLQLRTQMTNLERQREELIREKDGLNWTLGVILEYENFPVKTLCPQKECKPCPDGWVQFQSSCYLFTKSNLSSGWRCWEDSRKECRQEEANLVVIGSREEQEFISNHAEYYHDEKHGYWIGLSKRNEMQTWMWIDGSNFTVKYWKPEAVSSGSCVLNLPQADTLTNWNKAGCLMKNRWICEKRALIKESAALSKLNI
ncbi:C-type lectin domain family 4 member A-like [Symphorus nematophorus]